MVNSHLIKIKLVDARDIFSVVCVEGLVQLGVDAAVRTRFFHDRALHILPMVQLWTRCSYYWSGGGLGRGSIPRYRQGRSAKQLSIPV